jgi:hypothetical protein
MDLNALKSLLSLRFPVGVVGWVCEYVFPDQMFLDSSKDVELVDLYTCKTLPSTAETSDFAHRFPKNAVSKPLLIGECITFLSNDTNFTPGKLTFSK